MKIDILKLLLFVVVILVFCYLVGSFLTLDFNILMWPFDVRLIVAAIVFAIVVIITI